MRVPTGVKAAALDATPLQLVPLSSSLVGVGVKIIQGSTHHETFIKMRISVSGTVFLV